MAGWWRWDSDERVRVAGELARLIVWVIWIVSGFPRARVSGWGLLPVHGIAAAAGGRPSAADGVPVRRCSYTAASERTTE